MVHRHQDTHGKPCDRKKPAISVENDSNTYMHQNTHEKPCDRKKPAIRVENDSNVQIFQDSHEKPCDRKKSIKTQKNEKKSKNIKKNDKNRKSKNPNIISCNIRGLVPGTRRDKMTYLSTIADELNTDFLLITESHLSESHPESDTFIPGWQQIRSDRYKRQKGGVINYVRDQITVDEIITFTNSYVELICLFIPSLDLAMITLYRPPDTPAKKFIEALATIDDWINKMETKIGKAPNIITSGDFNFPGMGSWSNSDMDISATRAATRALNKGEIGNASDQIKNLIDIVQKHALNQVVKVPTRIENILDLIFVNNVDMIDHVETIENIKVSDHKMIVAHLNVEAANTTQDERKNFCTTSIPRFNLFKATPNQWQKARTELRESKFNLEASPSDITNELIDTIDKIVVKTFDKPSPPKNKGPGSKNIIPKNARTLMRRKLNLSRSIEKETEDIKIDIIKKKIEVIEEDLRKSVHKMRARQENTARADLNTAPQLLHELVSKLSKKSSKIGPLKRNKDTANLNDAEILSRQYSSVYSTPRDSDIIVLPEEFFGEDIDTPNIEDHDALKEFVVTEDLIKEAIDSLPPKAAPGPDGVPNILLKQLKHEVSPILLQIFTKSLETGSIPDAFLKAYVKPVKKPLKPRSDPASYRPLSLTSNIAKFLEKVVKKQLVYHMEKNNILSNAQHGFRSNRSCLSQLLQHYCDIITSLEEGRIHDVIYLDFSKAFDKVDRHILAKHMRKAAIKEKAATWIFRFLDGRSQQVITDNIISTPTPVKSGVPQGTVLGPQLFLLMINTLTEEDLTSKIGIFADDTRVGRGISTEEDIKNLQEDLNKIFAWKDQNNLEFNSDKFELVRHGSTFRTNKNSPDAYYFTDENEVIKEKKNVRDLGVTMSVSTDFHEQILKVCKNAREKINWIFRNFYSRDVIFMRFMWNSYVQPILDYSSQLWSPTKQLEIKMLEQIFKNFSARAQKDNKESHDFWSRLKRYNVRSQQRRSERFRIICIWKIIEKISPNCGIEWSENTKIGRYCAISVPPKKASDKVKTLQQSSFQVRGAKLFNTLPFYLREMSKCSLNSFKNNLDRFLSNIPDTALAQKYYPLPSDINTGLPSNSIIDWVRFFNVQTRTNKQIEEIECDIQESHKYREIQNSEWSHLLAQSAPPNRDQNQAAAPPSEENQANQFLLQTGEGLDG